MSELCLGENQTTKSERQQPCRSSLAPARKNEGAFRIHPLFLLVGVWYAFTGELFLFIMSALVAIQHELAHAFAAAKLGYKLNAIVLMPFGAIIDGDLEKITFKDEIYVAVWGPLCNLITAGVFVAVWWFVPTVYAFTDTAFTASLSIALVNLLPAYPLDGGRILRCALARAFFKSQPDERVAERKATSVCRIVSFLISAILLGFFIVTCVRATPNFTLLAFTVFLLFGAFGNKDKAAVYGKIDFSVADVLKKGAEIRRVAVLDSCAVKDVFKFLSRGTYLVLEVYDERERRLFELAQNELSDLFLQADTPYATLRELMQKIRDFSHKTR